MKVKLEQSNLHGEIAAPSSKSYTIRALVLAAMAHGESYIANPLICDDTKATRKVLEQLGANIKDHGDLWQVTGGNLRPSREPLYCQESAATLRFISALCATLPGKSTIVGGPTLSLRPHLPLLGALEQVGASCQQNRDTIIVDGSGIIGGTINIPGDISSQFISALLMVAPKARMPITISLTSPLRSRPYIDMTIKYMMDFGVSARVSPSQDRFEISPQEYRASDITVEGDWSSASYLLSHGAVSGPVTVFGLSPSSLQADRNVVNFLREMGAQVLMSEDRVTVISRTLLPIEADLEDAIDLLPTLSALASLASGRSVFTGVGRARLKESDRVQSMTEELGKMQVAVVPWDDTLIVYGGTPKGAILTSHNDHRIAMALSLPGLASGSTTIESAECVNKTYPSYWEDLITLGGKIEQYER